jgi:PAS domain S-box-containing protein
MFSALLAGLGGSSVVRAQEPPVLTTVRQIRALSPEEAGGQRPVRVRGLVTVLSGWKSSFFFLDGGNTSISVNRVNEDPPVEAGEEVEIRGVTSAGQFAPIIVADSVTVLGKRKLPAAPRMNYGELERGQQDSQWIGVRGIVRTANVKPAWGRSVLFLIIDMGGGNLITARVHDFSPSGIDKLVASEVTVRGVCGTVFNDKRQLVGLRLFVQNLDDMQIEQAAPENPFDGPTSPLNGLLQFSGEETVGAIPRVKVRGVLTYQAVGRGFYVQSGSDGLFVRSEQMARVPLGSELEVIGYPAAGSYSPTLVDALFQATGRVAPVHEQPMGSSEALLLKDGFLSAPYDSRLVQVRGQLIERMDGSDEEVLLLQDGPGVVPVRLKSEEGQRRFSPPASGAWLQVSGIFVAKVDEYREVRSFEILARNPGDIVVLEQASWWTRAHLIRAIVALGIVALLTLAGLTWLHREQRTAQIERSNAELTKEILARQKAQEDLQEKTDELSRINKQLEQYTSEELRRSDAIRITALESAQLGDWQIDLRSGVANRSLLHDRIFGYEEKLPEWSFEIFVSHVLEEDRARVARIYEENLKQGKRWDFECRIVWPDQSIHWIWACGGLYRDQAGEPTFVMGTVAEITARKQAEAAQAHSQKLESLGTLAGGIAHDFNNILLAITGNTKFAIADLPADHPVQRNLSEIAKAGSRATDLVRSILTFSRPGELKRKTINLQPVIEEALRLVRASIPASIKFQAGFASDVPPVLADSSQIHQILVNLATNAAHAIGGKSGGLIEILLDVVELAAIDPERPSQLSTGRYVRLSVADNGSGMAAGVRERIFDPFFTTKDVGEGTGLGLAVVHGIMKSHDGGTSVRSEPGVGSTFQLYFPPSEAGVAPEVAAPRLAARDRTETVLYVDDEEPLVELVTRTLKRLGYQVTGQSDPLVALEMFRANPKAFDVVVTDLAMPRLSGFELCKEILAIRPGFPIVMTSGYLRPEDQERALTMGLRDLILKPDTIDQLGYTLDRIFQMDLSES